MGGEHQLPNYFVAATAFKELGADESVAHAHGLLCGFLSVNPNISCADWLEQMTIAQNTPHQLVSEIFSTTKAQLGDSMFRFDLMIAPDDEMLDKRTDDLRDWSQGFLSGLGLGKLKSSSKDVLEIIQVLGMIAKNTGESTETEAEVKDFVDVLEFVRIGVLFIQEEVYSGGIQALPLPRHSLN